MITIECIKKYLIKADITIQYCQLSETGSKICGAIYYSKANAQNNHFVHIISAVDFCSIKEDLPMNTIVLGNIASLEQIDCKIVNLICIDAPNEIDLIHQINTYIENVASIHEGLGYFNSKSVNEIIKTGCKIFQSSMRFIDVDSDQAVAGVYKDKPISASISEACKNRKNDTTDIRKCGAVATQLEGHYYYYKFNSANHEFIFIFEDHAYDPELMRLFLLALEGKYMIELRKINDAERDKRNLFTDIINQNMSNSTQLQKIAMDQGWNLKDSYYFLKIVSREPREDIPPRMATSLITDITQILKLEFSIFDTGIYALFNRSQNNGLHRKNIESLLKKLLISHNATIGFSDPFVGLEKVFWVSKQPDIALKFGKIFNPHFFTHAFSMYMQYNLISNYATKYDLLSEVHPMIRELDEHDRKYGTDYVQTIYTFLNDDRKLQLAAETLNIHRNTLIQRLAKIEKITQYDFRQAFRTTHLRLSCCIIKYLRNFENNS